MTYSLVVDFNLFFGSHYKMVISVGCNASVLYYLHYFSTLAGSIFALLSVFVFYSKMRQRMAFHHFATIIPASGISFCLCVCEWVNKWVSPSQFIFYPVERKIYFFHRFPRFFRAFTAHVLVHVKFTPCVSHFLLSAFLFFSDYNHCCLCCCCSSFFAQ